MPAIAEIKSEVHELINELPERELGTLQRFVKFVLLELEDERELAPEVIASLDAARLAMENGETGTPHEDFRRELGF